MALLLYFTYSFLKTLAIHSQGIFVKKKIVFIVDRYKGVLIHLDAKRRVFASLQNGRILALWVEFRGEVSNS